MDLGNILLISLGSIAALSIVFYVFVKWVPKRLRTEKFSRKWKELQGFCRDRRTWGLALQEADKLLDSALKQRKFKGKTMGERMVSAQRIISNNDSMWYAHNLTKKLIETPSSRPKEGDIKNALVGFRNALKDLGALQTAQKPANDGDTEEKK